jgi:transcriptional regulator with XRE-family HTH domain
MRATRLLLTQHVVGEHVRRLRERAGLSLRALAARTDFSPSFISQLENGQVSPSIHSMEKIANALGVTLGAFFGHLAPSDSGRVTRSAERGRLASSWSNAEVEALGSLAPRQRLEPLLITLHPGGRSGKHPVAHPTEEFALVLDGSVRLRLGPEEHLLAKGDSVMLRPGELRLWTNDGSGDCVVVVVALRRAQ